MFFTTALHTLRTAGKPQSYDGSSKAFTLLLLLPGLLIFVACGIAAPRKVETPVATVTATEVGLPSAAPEAAFTPIRQLELPSELALRPSRTVRPVQLEEYLPNPYMGWQDTQRWDKRFVETVGYRRVNWKDVNPAEGIYDWSSIETLREDMVALRGTISFRIRTAQPPPWGDGQVMPQWLVARGALTATGGTDIEGLEASEPRYSGCLFLDAHGDFIEALRQRYDGDPDIAFIDIGSYGTYGEWDSYQYDEEVGSLDWHARRRIIDSYLGGQGKRPCLEIDGRVSEVSYSYPGFQKTQLVMPYTPWFSDSLVYALSRRSDIGIRHDALGSEKHQNKYREEIGALVAHTWPHAPIVFEFWPKAYTNEAIKSAMSFAREMHTSFVHDNFDGKGSNKLIHELLTNIGYRFVLHEMTYTSELGPGEELSFEMTWENTGVAPLYFKDYPLVILLTNAEGTSVSEQQLELDIRGWLPGQLIEVKGFMTAPEGLAPGDYTLRIMFIEPKDRQPALALAIEGRDELGRYPIGPVKVLP